MTADTTGVPAAPPAIEANEVSRHFGTGTARVDVLSDVSFVVEVGEWVAIMGPSGSGKTTLLHVLGGLDGVDSGSVLVGGKPMSAAGEAERARRRRSEVSYVFQQYNLLSDLTALQNVMLPLQMLGMRKRSANTRATEILDQLGLSPQAGDYPATLSGGEQQRVALARALVVEPLVLLADEPTGALDTDAGSMVLDLLKTRHDNGQTLVMVTHDHQVAAKADRILRMVDGKLVDEHRMGAVHASDLSNLLRLEVD